MDVDINREIRKAKRDLELGENPVCQLCGYSKPYALKRITRTVFEEHHPGGWRNEWGLTVVLCRNCHWEQTETIRDEGISMKKCPTFPERLVVILKCLKIFFLSLAQACGRWAQELADSISKGQAYGNHTV